MLGQTGRNGAQYAASMLFMIVESYKGGDPRPVYERFRERGRMAPTGLDYVASWVTVDLTKCYQVMEGERDAIDQWIGNWNDLVDFEIIPVVSSAEAALRASCMP